MAVFFEFTEWNPLFMHSLRSAFIKLFLIELIAKVFRNSGIYMFESVHERM